MNETIYSEDWRHLLEHGILKIVLGSHLEIDNKTLFDADTTYFGQGHEEAKLVIIRGLPFCWSAFMAPENDI